MNHNFDQGLKQIIIQRKHFMKAMKVANYERDLGIYLSFIRGVYCNTLRAMFFEGQGKRLGDGPLLGYIDLQLSCCCG